MVTFRMCGQLLVRTLETKISLFNKVQLIIVKYTIKAKISKSSGLNHNLNQEKQVSRSINNYKSSKLIETANYLNFLSK